MNVPPTKAALGASVASYSAWNLVAYLVGIGANIFTMPFVLHRLGPTAFGIAALVQATVAPFTLIAGTLGVATARQLAAATTGLTARADFGTSAAVALLVACAGITLITLGGPAIATHLFAISTRDAELLRPAYLAAAIGWGVTVGTGILQALYVATRDYRRLAHIGAFGAVATAAATFILVSRFSTVVSYLSALAIGFCLTFIAWIIAAATEKRSLLSAPRWDTGRLRALGHFSGWQFAAQLGGIASIQADRYLLGAYTSPADVAYFSVAQRLEEVGYIGVAKAGEVLFPVFSAEANSARARQSDLYFRAAWILNLLAGCTLGPLLPLSEDVLRIWTNAGIAHEAQNVLFILTLGGMLGCAVNALAYFTMGLARTHLNFILALVTAAISCAFSAVLLPRYGLAAAGIGTLCAMTGQLIAGVVISDRLFGDRRFGRQLFAVVGPLLVAVFVGCTLRYAHLLPHPENWASLAVIAAGIAVFIAIITIGTSYLSTHGAVSRGDLLSIVARLVPAQLLRSRC